MNKILVASATCGTGISREELRKIFEDQDLNPEFKPLKDSLDELGDYEAILIGTELITEEILDLAKNCKVVMKYGVGTDNIDAEACRKRNITVESMPGINSATVAEMALALMFAAGRMVSQSDRALKEGRWERNLGVSVTGKTLGIIGTGAIGRKLAQFVSGMDMKVIGYDVYQNDEFRKMGEYVSLEELCAQSDYISVHVPLTKDTYHLISDKEFAMMKDSAVVINTARGGIIDENALCKALKEGKIKAAALDVYEGEKPKDKELLSIPNLITTPHIAAYAYETLRRMDETSARKLSSVLRSKGGDNNA